MKKLLLILGTRPETIKQAPLWWAAAAVPGWEVQICFTGQHREMGEQMLADLGLPCHYRLDLMRPDQTPAAFIGAAVPAIETVLRQSQPDWVAVQGDTTSALAGALASFYSRIPLVHIEAGLRTYDRTQPFPEEMHRQLVTRLAVAHCAPTETARAALLREAVPDASILMCGNTGIDCLLHVARLLRANPPPADASVLPPGVQARLYANGAPTAARLVLITGHRRESFGGGFIAICRAVRRLAETFSTVEFVYPVHLNPQVRTVVHEMLTGLPNLHLIEPLAYRPFVQLMDRATLLLTDSGGIQEEAPALGKPVLVMRNVTERMEAVECGAAQLVGNDEARLYAATARLLSDEAAFRAMAVPRFPYGDGSSARRILAWLAEFLGAPRGP